MIVDPADDGLWLGLWSGAVVNVFAGKVRKSLRLPDTQSDAMSATLVRQLRFDPDAWILEVEDRAGRHFLDQVLA